MQLYEVLMNDLKVGRPSGQVAEGLLAKAQPPAGWPSPSPGPLADPAHQFIFLEYNWDETPNTRIYLL
jgi:hypothetical protein